GFANVDVETPGGSDDKTELTWGLGAQYDVSARLGVRAGWQRYETDEEVDLLSIGVVYRF
ncbi:MAG: OmpA-like transrane domain, partial [Burkholderiales bacterium]|nr:OmpA-like transrane domain [Burkholderiales bacterium]